MNRILSFILQIKVLCQAICWSYIVLYLINRKAQTLVYKNEKRYNGLNTLSQLSTTINTIIQCFRDAIKIY